MKTKLIPKSRAKTAYGLLSEIAALALAEPLRMRMSGWLNTRQMPGRVSEFPACGTVGCIGGWTSVLRKKRGKGSGEMLGLNGDQCDELFMDGRLMYANNQQTPQHAKAVASHIRKFQKKYRAQLLAKKV